jgi:hypothetical protein
VKAPKTPTFDIRDAVPVPVAQTMIYEHFAGKPLKGLYDAQGCRLNLEAVICRAYVADPFEIALKIGDSWYRFARIAHGDPGLDELPITSCPPDPQRLAREKRDEQIQADALAAEQAQRQAKADLWSFITRKAGLGKADEQTSQAG